MVLIFDLGISKGCHTILQNYQEWKLVFSGISKGKVTNLRMPGFLFKTVYLQPSPVWIFSGIAHCNSPLPHDRVEPWENMRNSPSRCPKNTFPECFCNKLSFLHLISNVLVISTHWRRLRLCYRFLCSMFSKDTSPFDFIKRKRAQEKGTQNSAKFSV